MLRRVVFAVGCALLLGGCAILASGGDHGAWVLVINGLLITGGLAFERYRYKPDLTAPPGPGWVRTEEKSVEAGGVVSVWFNPASGERAYVREKEGKTYF